MDHQKLKVIVVYSPETGDIKSLAEKIGHEYKEAGCIVTIKPAVKVTIPEINAAQLLVFGSEEEGASFPDGGFKEIVRTFTGINLVQKNGVLFSYSKQTAIDGLKAMVKDTGLKLHVSDFIYSMNGKTAKDKKLEKWIKQTCTSKV